MIVPQKPGSTGNRRVEPLSRRPVDHLLRPAPSVRLLARLRAAALDRALLAGADPAHSGQLAARAQALTSPRSRAAAVDGLERWLSAADGATSQRRVLPRRALALTNASEVREIVSLLRGSAPLTRTESRCSARCSATVPGRRTSAMATSCPAGSGKCTRR